MLSVQSMCLLAGVLSRNYGVNVTYGGTDAYTKVEKDKTVINIPGIESDDPEYLTKVRGFIDHEVGHVRFTNHALTRGLDGLRHTLWNVFEDYYVESKMGELFVGCKQNLAKLSKQLFSEPETVVEGLNAVVSYVLMGVRSKLVPELSEAQKAYADAVDRFIPGVRGTLDSIIDRAPAECTSTKGALGLSQEVFDAIHDHVDEETQQKMEYSSGGTTGDVGETAARSISYDGEDAARQGKAVAGSMDVQGDGEKGGRRAGQYRGEVAPKLLSNDQMTMVGKLSAAFDVQLRSLLQTWVMNRGGNVRQGQLDMHKLHRLVTGDARIFQRREERRGIDTEVIILSDSSGSMHGEKANLTSCATAGLVKSLKKIPGVQTSVLMFNSDSVYVALTPGMPMHSRFNMQAYGGTRAGAAMMESLRRFTGQKSRKVLIVMSDGETFDPDVMTQAVKLAERMKVSLVGLGIQSSALIDFFGAARCGLVEQMDRLCSVLFKVMREQLVCGGVR